MRTARKFTTYVNLGALVLLLAAMVALVLSQRGPRKGDRGPASVAETSSHPR